MLAVMSIHARSRDACMWQDIIRQVEQGSSRVLQAVDWPQSSPDGHCDQDGQNDEAETSPDDDSTGEVCMHAGSDCIAVKTQLEQSTTQHTLSLAYIQNV